MWHLLLHKVKSYHICTVSSTFWDGFSFNFIITFKITDKAVTGLQCIVLSLPVPRENVLFSFAKSQWKLISDGKKNSLFIPDSRLLLSDQNHILYLDTDINAAISGSKFHWHLPARFMAEGKISQKNNFVCLPIFQQEKLQKSQSKLVRKQDTILSCYMRLIKNER